jgi:hypothetical protein
MSICRAPLLCLAMAATTDYPMYVLYSVSRQYNRLSNLPTIRSALYGAKLIQTNLCAVLYSVSHYYNRLFAVLYSVWRCYKRLSALLYSTLLLPVDTSVSVLAGGVLVCDLVDVPF